MSLDKEDILAQMLEADRRKVEGNSLTTVSTQPNPWGTTPNPWTSISNHSTHPMHSGSTYPSNCEISDDTTYKFTDGTSITGKQLGICVKLLKKMAMEEFPEEFI